MFCTTRWPFSSTKSVRLGGSIPVIIFYIHLVLFMAWFIMILWLPIPYLLLDQCKFIPPSLFCFIDDLAELLIYECYWAQDGKHPTFPSPYRNDDKGELGLHYFPDLKHLELTHFVPAYVWSWWIFNGSITCYTPSMSSDVSVSCVILNLVLLCVDICTCPIPLCHATQYAFGNWDPLLAGTESISTCLPH